MRGCSTSPKRCAAPDAQRDPAQFGRTVCVRARSMRRIFARPHAAARQVTARRSVASRPRARALWCGSSRVRRAVEATLRAGGSHPKARNCGSTAICTGAGSSPIRGRCRLTVGPHRHAVPRPTAAALRPGPSRRPRERGLPQRGDARWWASRVAQGQPRRCADKRAAGRGVGRRRGRLGRASSSRCRGLEPRA